MIHRLPTNCRQKILHLWARQHTGATINEITTLNPAKLCESVVFLHSQNRLTVLTIIHRLPTNCRRKLFHLWARLEREGTINEITPLNRAELRESVVFLHSHSSLTVLVNDPQI